MNRYPAMVAGLCVLINMTDSFGNHALSFSATVVVREWSRMDPRLPALAASTAAFRAKRL
jgi:hypothetical protein